MRMDAAKTAITVLRHTSTAEVRHLDLFRVADHHVFDLALPIQKNADLAARLERDLGHLPGKFGRDNIRRRYASSAKAFDTHQLIVF